jgi:hypothetical protein
VHDDRNHGEEQKQVDQQPCALEHYKPAQPQHNQNYREDKKHWQTLLSFFKCVTSSLPNYERRRLRDALLGMKRNMQDSRVLG